MVFLNLNQMQKKSLMKRKKSHDWNVFIPKFEYCTDNAAMIAILGYYKFKKQDFSSYNITASARITF